MIFARRALQRRLDELRPVLGATETAKLAARLNRPGRDRMSAMWEVAVLHALSRLGTLRVEAPLPSGRRPDIAFVSPRLAFTADVTSVSDEGLNTQNPVSELMMEIEAAKTRLGLAIGGMDLQIHSQRVEKSRGTQTVLRIPRRERVREFVRDQVVPKLREQIAAGEQILKLAFAGDEVGLEITIDPSKSPYNSGSYAAYDTPTIRDQNPLYKAMKSKADQLRAAEGIKGIFVGDADSRTLADRGFSQSGLSAGEIARELLRQYSSIDFVLLLSVREEPYSWMQVRPPTRALHASFHAQRDHAATAALDGLLRQMMAEMPQPVMMPVNGVLRAQEPGYDLGHHGGYGVAGSKIRVGARELVEILAGRRTIWDNGVKFPEKIPATNRARNIAQAAFERQLLEGRLPSTISVIHTDENDSDNWIEFEFGEPDPAISPLR